MIDDEAEAKSLHHLLTHFPKNKACETCRMAKAYMRPHRGKKNCADHDRVDSFGEIVTMDHMVMSKSWARGQGGMRAALTLRALATRYCDCIPVTTKGAIQAALA